MTTGLLTMAILQASPARADGLYRWENERSNGYLEVSGSSLNDHASVLTWPFNPTSLNQWWIDTKMENASGGGYYRLENYNSWKVLDRWDEGMYSTGRCGRVMQFSDTGQDWQRWKYRRYWSAHYGRDFIMWINKYGCNGNPYHDVLTADIEDSAMTFLHTESHCDDTSYGIPTHCYWKRDGV